jgi:hypothetical protein
MAGSPFFIAKPNQFKRLGGRTDPKFDLVDPTMPVGFLMWEQTRTNGKHVDRLFLSPDGMYSFRSRTSTVEYIKLLGRCHFYSSLYLHMHIILAARFNYL